MLYLEIKTLYANHSYATIVKSTITTWPRNPRRCIKLTGYETA